MSSTCPPIFRKPNLSSNFFEGRLSGATVATNRSIPLFCSAHRIVVTSGHSAQDQTWKLGRSMRVPTIRSYRDEDRASLRQAFVALQEAERALHDSRLPGADIATPYLDWMQTRVATRDGAILVAETDGVFQGFVACWVMHTDHIIETLESNRHGYVSDICVLADWRGQGIAAHLLAAAETHLARQGVTRVRIGSLAANQSALSAYRKHGFAPYEVVLEKRLEPPAARL